MESMKDFENELEESYKVMGDGEKGTDELIAWENIKKWHEEKEIITVTVSGVVKGGVIAVVEGIRGLIPASRLALKRVEDLNEYLGKEVRVRIIEVNPEGNKLIMSAKEILRQEQADERKNQIAKIEVGSVLTGKVDGIQNYGAFVDLGNHISGLVHISQISNERIKHPSAVLKEGQEVEVKVIGNKDGKISLSMKALLEPVEKEAEEKVVIPKSEPISTSMADLLKNIKL